MGQRSVKRLEILNGWKEISTYLGKGVRTVQRYERELNLPIRRPAGRSAGSVVATKAELDAWVMAGPIRHAFHLPKPEFDDEALRTLTSNVSALRQLRKETVQLRESMSISLDQLQETLRLTIPGTADLLLTRRTGVATSAERKLMGEVLPFHSPKRKMN